MSDGYGYGDGYGDGYGNGNGNGNGYGNGSGYGYGYGYGYGLSNMIELSDSTMTIGCQSHSLAHWIEHGREIAKANDVPDISVNLLMHHIKSLAS